MDAGRELDAIIAERFFGWRVASTYRPWEMIPPGEDEQTWRECPNYSTDIAAAWQVMERLRNLGWSPGVSTVMEAHGDDWRCDLYFAKEGEHHGACEDAFANTAPLAICRAALLAESSRVR